MSTNKRLVRDIDVENLYNLSNATTQLTYTDSSGVVQPVSLGYGMQFSNGTLSSTVNKDFTNIFLLMGV